MYKKTIFLYGGKGLVRKGNNLYNRNAPKSSGKTKQLDDYLLSMIKGVSLQSKASAQRKKGSGAVKKYYAGSGLKFVR
jgi:hypothetical protein